MCRGQGAVWKSGVVSQSLGESAGLPGGPGLLALSSLCFLAGHLGLSGPCPSEAKRCCPLRAGDARSAWFLVMTLQGGPRRRTSLRDSQRDTQRLSSQALGSAHLDRCVSVFGALLCARVYLARKRFLGVFVLCLNHNSTRAYFQ